MNQQEFVERQYFHWLSRFFVIGITVFSLIFSFLAWRKNGLEQGALKSGFWIRAIILIVITLWINVIKLESIINQEGIYFRFGFMHLRYKFIAWSDIDSVHVVRYSLFHRYIGVGVHHSLSWKHPFVAYTASGRLGIEVEQTNGSVVFIGTQHPVDAQEALISFSRQRP